MGRVVPSEVVPVVELSKPYVSIIPSVRQIVLTSEPDQEVTTDIPLEGALPAPAWMDAEGAGAQLDEDEEASLDQDEDD